MSYGHALKTAGRQTESIDAYRKSIELAPHSAKRTGASRTSRPSASRRRTSRRCARSSRARISRDEDRFHFTSRSARRSRTQASTSESFEHYARGNALRRAGMRLRRRRDHGARAALESAVHPGVLRRARAAAAARRPIRSSSSACRAPARRCSSRSSRATPQVEGTHGAAGHHRHARARSAAARRAAQESKYPEVLATLGADDFRALGEQYLEQTRIQRKTAAPFFIDKMPNNFAARRPDPSDPAEREDHRRAPPSARLLLLGLQAAFRARPALHLRPRRHRPLLPRLRGADGALRRGAARPRPPGVLRAHGRGHRRRGAAPAGLLRPAVRGSAACASTRTSAPCAPRAPSRCASRSIARV